jgi:hypothetical protein
MIAAITLILIFLIFPISRYFSYLLIGRIFRILKKTKKELINISVTSSLLYPILVAIGIFIVEVIALYLFPSFRMSGYMFWLVGLSIMTLASMTLAFILIDDKKRISRFYIVELLVDVISASLFAILINLHYGYFSFFWGWK